MPIKWINVPQNVARPPPEMVCPGKSKGRWIRNVLPLIMGQRTKFRSGVPYLSVVSIGLKITGRFNNKEAFSKRLFSFEYRRAVRPRRL